MFIILSSVENTTQPPTYSLQEIIFWYSALIVTLIITIFILTHRKTNRKKIEIISNKLSLEAKKYESLINDKEMNRNKFKDIGNKTIIILSGFETTFIDLKDKTKLGDFDNLIKEKNNLIDYIRKLDNKKDINIDKESQNIKNKLLDFKSNIEQVKSYLK
ncbi:MAG: hypothetical protein V8R16_08880 [Bacilli bacterium]